MEHVTYGEMLPKEQSRLQELFGSCFGFPDEGRYVLGQQSYLTQYVARVEDTAAAMLSVMPVSVRSADKNFSAAYLYGVATHPDYRGAGLCTGLMRYVHQVLQEQGVQFSILVPSSEENRGFYAARGYRGASFLCYGTYSVKTEPAVSIAPVSVQEYCQLRRRFAPRCSMLWGQEGVAFQQGWLSLYGGSFLRLGDRNAPIGCAAVSREAEGYFVRELLTPAKQTTPALGALCRGLEILSVRYALPEEQGRAMRLPLSPLAMVYPLGTKEPFPYDCYINLVLD